MIFFKKMAISELFGQHLFLLKFLLKSDYQLFKAVIESKKYKTIIRKLLREIFFNISNLTIDLDDSVLKTIQSKHKIVLVISKGANPTYLLKNWKIIKTGIQIGLNFAEKDAH